MAFKNDYDRCFRILSVALYCLLLFSVVFRCFPGDLSCFFVAFDCFLLFDWFLILLIVFPYFQLPSVALPCSLSLSVTFRCFHWIPLLSIPFYSFPLLSITFCCFPLLCVSFCRLPLLDVSFRYFSLVRFTGGTNIEQTFSKH